MFEASLWYKVVLNAIGIDKSTSESDKCGQEMIPYFIADIQNNAISWISGSGMTGKDRGIWHYRLVGINAAISLVNAYEIWIHIV